MSGTIQEEAKDVLAVMARELQRSMTGLRIPGSPRPYHLLYALRRRQTIGIVASYGALQKSESKERSSIFVDLRVGNHRFDNVVDAGLHEDASERESAEWLDAPLDLDPMAVQIAFWKLTQIKFDEALEDYYDHRKTMVSEYLKDEQDSFTQERAIVHEEVIHSDPFPQEEWERALVRLSRRFLEEAEIYDPQISLRGERVHRWLVSHDGTRVLTENLYLHFFVSGWILTDDGVYVEASRSRYLRTMEEMPQEADMSALLDEVLSELAALKVAESPGAFIGPALLAGQAASTVFHEALGHRLEGGRLVARGETRTFAHKRGQQVVPESLSIYDDPSMTHFQGEAMWGSYRVDDEGVASSRVDLIKDGVLIDFLRNRTPIPAAKGGTPAISCSSGHGRHDGVQQTMARMGNLIVECSETEMLSWEVLEERLLDLARSQGRKEAAVIMKISNGETSTSSYDFQVFKGEISEVYLIDVESKKKRRVRDLELIGTPLSALQRIVACGGPTELDYGYCYAESGSIPVGGISPGILLSEVELQQQSTVNFHEPLLPSPFADDGSRGRTGKLRSRGYRRKK